MTGYGEASHQSDLLNLPLELRYVNNRSLKVSVRATEPYNLLEAEFEKVIRRTIKRGTIQVHLRCQRRSSPQDFQINVVALRSYLDQIRRACADLELPDRGQSLVSQALMLPGFVPDASQSGFNLEHQCPVLERVLEQAISGLQTMRQEEGRAMAAELLQHRDAIAGGLEKIRRRIPEVSV